MKHVIVVVGQKQMESVNLSDLENYFQKIPYAYMDNVTMYKQLNL